MAKGFEYYKSLPYADRKYENVPKVTTPTVFQLTKTGDTVTLFPTYDADEVPEELLSLAHDEFNYCVEEGKTYPHNNLFDYAGFLAYTYEGMTAFLLRGNHSSGLPTLSREEYKNIYLGHFYVKPNYIGRCSHVCNAGFIVAHEQRGLGLGIEMGKEYLKLAPKLGYAYSVFNLVFETNVASVRIWEKLGFEKIGYVKNVAVLKGEDRLVGAYIFGKDL